MSFKASKPETIMENWLRKRNIPFIGQQRFSRSPIVVNRYRRADFFFPQLRLVVLIDGSPWHTNPEERSYEEIFYKSIGLFVTRIPAEKIEEDVEEAMKWYLPQLLIGQSITDDIVPVVISGFGKGRQREPTRKYSR